MSFFTRPRREPTFNEEIDLLFVFISLKTTHPGKDETGMRLSKMEANENKKRLIQNFSSETPQYRNFVRDRDETKSLGTFSLETETLVLHWFTVSKILVMPTSILGFVRG